MKMVKMACALAALTAAAPAFSQTTLAPLDPNRAPCSIMVIFFTQQSVLQPAVTIYLQGIQDAAGMAGMSASDFRGAFSAECAEQRSLSIGSIAMRVLSNQQP